MAIVLSAFASGVILYALALITTMLLGKSVELFASTATTVLLVATGIGLSYSAWLTIYDLLVRVG